MKTEFTKGPWSIDYDTRPAEVCTIYGVSNAPDNQGFLYVRGQLGDWSADENTNRANANLIAAAPDLYAELVKAKADMVSMANNAVEKLRALAPEYTWDSGETVAEMYTRSIDAVLAKARGEQP
jgi:hypothetical protein